MATADQKIAEAEQILGYSFTNKLLCAEAVQMAGPRAFLAISGAFQTLDKNHRLAVLGDGVLAKVLCDK